jgi:hypothetical protein
MLIYMTPKFNYIYMTLCCLTDIDLYQKYITLYIYIIWCLLGYICSCFLHTLDRLVHGYKLSRFCTLPRKSRRFIAREQKLVYSNSEMKESIQKLPLEIFVLMLFCKYSYKIIKYHLCMSLVIM